MIKDALSEQLIGHLSRDSSAIDARETIVKQDKTEVPLIDHNPRKGEKREFAPYEAQRYKTLSGAER